ncbi:FtsX-like permease family protein [Sphaerisporangium sp. NPDC005288]|uniref:FtsX-like permease family protein n=1 Tax=Sphaerisporangium sp. NPDC005288 TaxID=3155114 RepID=UPI0033BA7F43
MNPLLLLRVHRGAATVLALLALSATLLVCALPRAFERSYDDALHGVLDDTAASLTDVTVEVRAPSTSALGTENAFAAGDRHFRGLLPAPVAQVMDHGPGADSHYGAKTIGTPVAGRLEGGARPYQYVDMAWLSGANRRIRYVAGAPPGAPVTLARVPGRPELTDVTLFEIALSKQASDKMGIPIGATLILGNSRPSLARVTGLYQALNPRDRYWQHNNDLLTVTVLRQPNLDAEELYITGLTSPQSLAKLSGEARALRYLWVLGVQNRALTARNAAPVIDGIGAYLRTIVTDANGPITYDPQIRIAPYDLDTALPQVLGKFLDRLSTAQTLMFLILGGLITVAVGVLALAVQLLAERMRSGLTLARARGASLRQIVLTGTGAVTLALVPSVLAGYCLTFAFPGPATPIVHLGPLLITLVTIAFTAARLAAGHRSPIEDRRDDVVARRPSPRRIALEVVVVVLALAGAYLLRTRGLTTQALRQGADPFLMLVPAALTVAAALITLRCYPYPLRLIVWAAARARSAVPFVGLTLAARARSVTSLPVLILLPALTVSVYGAVVGGALEQTQRLAAWQATGAAARVEASAELPTDVVERVRRVPGVQQILPADKGIAQVGLGGRTATVVAVDLDAYRRILAGSPLDPPHAAPGLPGAAIPALVSPDLAGMSSFEIGWHVRMKLTKAGVIREGLPGVSFTVNNLIVVPYDASKRAGFRTFTTMLLIAGQDIDGAKLKAATGNRRDILVSTFDESLRQVTATPLAGTIMTSFRVVTAALAVYALLTVIIALVIGAAERARALSYLRTLGLSERQASALTVLEITPLILLTACAGLLLGLALPAALGPAIDLSAYAGALTVGDYRLSPTTPVLLAAGLAAVSVLGAFLHARFGAHRSLGSALRVGE